MSNEQRESLRAQALARYAARKEAETASPPAPAKAETPASIPVVGAADGTFRGSYQTGESVEGSPPVVVANPAYATPAAPRELFKAWLRSASGALATDTRVSTDRVRFAAEIEDRVWLGWQAGYEAGKEGA